MGTYFESGIGKATWGTSLEMGRSAALEALSHLANFQPSLALVFICSELDIDAVNHGVAQILGECPIIGTSTAGEIANGLVMDGVVVCVMGSPHLKVRVGMGRGVSGDFKKAVNQALDDAGISQYFNPDHPEHQMLNVSAAGALGASPVLLIVFSPGSTKFQLSLSHDIHTELRKASANRIPIFGGSSADYFHYRRNYQIANNQVCSDSVAIAFLEAEILFGLGMAHGFCPTTKRALVTRASPHVVHELDGRPAAQIYAELLEISVEKLMEMHAAGGPSPLSSSPLGTIDVYGNSILHVPERILDDGSIVFPHMLRNDQVVTLMRGPKKDIVKAGLSAYRKAIHYGGLSRPCLVLMFSCALRLMGQRESEEIELVYKRSNVPVCGFYTYGEKGVFDDGIPAYANDSVSMLVFSDELNPIASLIHKSKNIYREFAFRLDQKLSQIKSIGEINQIIQDGTDINRLLGALAAQLSILFPWAHGAFYLATDNPETYALANASDLDQFPGQIRADEKKSGYIFISLDSPGKRFGVMVLKQKELALPLVEEDIVLAETIAKLTASGLHRIEVEGQVEMKLQQLEILNQLGYELSKTVSASSQSQNILKHIRRILKLSFASLWLVDRAHHLLVKEAMDGDSGFEIGGVEKENDERLARWQIDHQQPLIFTEAADGRCPIKLVPPFTLSFVSIPVMYKGEIRGILNLYTSRQYKWSLQYDRIFENMEFLQSISTQIAMFVENRSLYKHATFFKEMHHRVKNNLQNIASLLRMQLRRLDHVSAERALSDSISRIMSIALVHETLSQDEIGLVDLGRLVGTISKLPECESLQGPAITLDITGPPVFIPSREATSLALVLNELVQNAFQHGFRERDTGRLSIRVEHSDGHVCVVVQDDGPGVPENFDIARDGNLGLTIVRTLVKDELRGRFELDCSNGTSARVTFPYPESYYEIE